MDKVELYIQITKIIIGLALLGVGVVLLTKI